MNHNGFSHLAWKEYRAVRGFWLSMIGLVIVVGGLTVALSTHLNLSMLYSLALGAPAFFALGCCGAAFAVEKEEGTFDFLRASPATARQIVASKLLVAAVATAAMFAVLWLLALMSCRGQLPDSKVLRELLGLWLLAAVEAIAWGTLFSLASARPLVAVVLGLFVASTVAHLLAWSSTRGSFHAFELAPYFAAVPRRALVALAVLAVDIYWGLRWLDQGESNLRGPWTRATAATTGAVVEAQRALGKARARLAAEQLLARPDRGGVIAHLAWQHVRQSGWLMALVAGIHMVIGYLVWIAALRVTSTVIFTGLVPALLGAMVFLGDQERRRFRFFVEHNVPARWVWLSRQLPWLSVLVVSTAVVVIAAIGPSNLVRIWLVGIAATDPYHPARYPELDFIHIPPIALGLWVVAVSYAAGQWTSMMIRSGVMAGFCAVLLAGVLSAWTILMDAWHVGFLWSVAPIPIVLLWATWLRAPDWILENATWKARRRAGAAVLVPALALLVAVPLDRVVSVSAVSPGFGPASFLSSQITPDAKATGDLYRQANELSYSLEHERAAVVGHAPTIRGREWLDDNADALKLILEAAKRPSCAFDDPRSVTNPTRLGDRLIWLVITDARLLEAGGNLDEALDRYLAALRVVGHLTNHTSDISLNARQYSLEGIRLVFGEIAQWGAQWGQSAERIRDAINKLQAIDGSILSLDELLKSQYIVARRYVSGDATAWNVLVDDVKSHPPTMLWPKLMPWETYRGQRALNVFMAYDLRRLERMRESLDKGEGVASYLPEMPAWYYNVQSHYYYDIDFSLQMEDAYRRQDEPLWLSSVTPDLWSVRAAGQLAARALAEFEAWRRGTLLVLGLEAFRLEHGKLPDSLNELLGSYFDMLPLDPYSGNEFCYYPAGLPAPANAVERNEAAQLRKHEQGMFGWGLPCVWCRGPELAEVMNSSERQPVTAQDAPSKRAPLTCEQVAYYTLRQAGRESIRLPSHVAWSWGFYFEIPKQAK